MKTPTKTLLAAVGVRGLTVVHYLYGARIYKAPFRRHVASGMLPVLLALIFAHEVRAGVPRLPGRVSLRLLMVVTLIVPVGLIGLFEGGYNHLVKNVLYFGVHREVCSGVSIRLLRTKCPTTSGSKRPAFFSSLPDCTRGIASRDCGEKPTETGHGPSGL